MDTNKEVFRTIPKAVEYLHNEDPDSPVSSYLLRKAISDKKIPAYTLGKRKIVRVQDIEDYLKGTSRQNQNTDFASFRNESCQDDCERT